MTTKKRTRRRRRSRRRGLLIGTQAARNPALLFLRSKRASLLGEHKKARLQLLWGQQYLSYVRTVILFSRFRFIFVCQGPEECVDTLTVTGPAFSPPLRCRYLRLSVGNTADRPDDQNTKRSGDAKCKPCTHASQIKLYSSQ